MSSRPSERLSRRYLRRLGVIGLAGLVALALAYCVTSEPAPEIRVLWRAGMDPARRAELERQFLLVNPRPSEDRLSYDVLDTTRDNLEALVNERDALDTDRVSREHFTVPVIEPSAVSRMWLAHRTPGLRDARVRWTVIVMLAAVVIAGLRREALATLRAAASITFRGAALWRASRHTPIHTADVFDRLSTTFCSLAPAANSQTSGGAGAVLKKMIAGALLLATAGVPVLATWESLALAAGWMALMFSVCRPGHWRLLAAAVVAFGVGGLKTALPRADIPEAHNAFMVLGDGEPLQQGLPAAVFSSWRAQFEALYPARAEPDPDYSWRAQKAIPRTLYARSTDAIWRPARYTRQVDAISFRTLAEFRGGFTSEMYTYNFWTGDLLRELMPFYVMYEWTPASVGSQLAWTGQLFWEGTPGEFQEIVHSQVAERTIQPEDVGKRVYAAFFPIERGPDFYFELVPSLKLWLARWAEGLLTLLGGVIVLAYVIRPQWSAYLRALSIFVVGYIVMTSFVRPDSGRLGQRYLPHGGGGDGLFHENGGRTMAMLVGQGEFIDALQGTEDVYWFTPGTRYVRMVEKLIFSDTNHLFTLLLAGVPILIFYIMRRSVGALPAWVMTGIFCVLPVGNFSFLQYVANARAGYGDAIGSGFFLLGLALLLYNQPAAAERSLPLLWGAGAALAAAMFVRPNLALAVVWLGCLYAWVSWTRRDRYGILAVGAGLGLALWMPFHNWFYGGELYLISKSGATISVPLGLRDYLSATVDVLHGRTGTAAITATSTQIAGWMSGPVFLHQDSLRSLAWTAQLVDSAALVVTIWVACRYIMRGLSKGTDLVFIAGAAIWAHVPMLFIFSTHYRYAMLAWDLSVMVLLVWLLRSLEVGGRADRAALQLELTPV